MAMNVGEQEEGGLMSEINTTPLVDVMLVLLIIFLITVPVVIQTVPVELPKVANIPTTTKPENVPLSVDANCDIFWGLGRLDSTDQLREKGAAYLLSEVEKQKAAGAKIELPEVHIRGDSNTEYRCVGGAIFAMQRAGYQKIGFISEPPAGNVTR
ncbi:biopolymer transporter ExbD [Sandaracinobacter sp. RS1-74]|uniref:ExbD/TolR family protein n=1 Tax=Sandaracinobacteroides sayramensis TaxID=2913411 RepID=UPI001EDB3D5D|nr:biopolymer transporter ExbD [Sandaracinobacteroides sayramensis]MCG2841330.1 biopolymer transporter ExbD [Sandaracinobacteroides sayramensis]